jgi:hypothetical protein
MIETASRNYSRRGGVQHHSGFAGQSQRSERLLQERVHPLLYSTPHRISVSVCIRLQTAPGLRPIVAPLPTAMTPPLLGSARLVRR